MMLMLLLAVISAAAATHGGGSCSRQQDQRPWVSMVIADVATVGRLPERGGGCRGCLTAAGARMVRAAGSRPERSRWRLEKVGGRLCGWRQSGCGLLCAGGSSSSGGGGGAGAGGLPDGGCEDEEAVRYWRCALAGGIVRWGGGLPDGRREREAAAAFYSSGGGRCQHEVATADRGKKERKTLFSVCLSLCHCRCVAHGGAAAAAACRLQPAAAATALRLLSLLFHPLLLAAAPPPVTSAAAVTAWRHTV